MRRVLFCLFLLQAFPAAAAGDFVPAGPLGSTVLDLDVKCGNYSAWRIADASGINAIRARLEVYHLGTDNPPCAPAFAITLLNEKIGTSASFQMRSESGRPPLSLHFEADKTGGEDDDQTFTFTLALSEPLSVAIDWTADGTVSIKAGPEKRTIALGVPIDVVRFSATTGEVLFDPLEVGTTAPR